MKELYNIKNQRATLLDEAEKAILAKDKTTYDAKMDEIKKLNGEIEQIEMLDAERGRFAADNQRMIDLAQMQQRQKEDSAKMNRVDAARSGNEYVQAFANALRSGASIRSGIANESFKPLYNALTESGGSPAGSDGGFLVPTEFDNMIHLKMKELVRLSDYVNVETVNALSGWRAVETSATRKKLPEVSENAAITPNDQPSFAKITYTIKKYADRLPISRELLDDNTAGLMQYIANWFAPRVVMTENSLILAALDTLTASNLTSGSEVKNIKSILNKTLNTAISKNAIILTNGNGYDFLDQLTGTDGRGLLVPDLTAPDSYRFKNRPVICADSDLVPSRTVSTTGATKGDYDPIYIGYLKAFCTLFRRKALEFATTDIGGNAWANDAPEIRGICRMDLQKVDTDAAVKREIFTAAT
ncbi:phage major capsid protein [Dialister invisus]|uniref:phage major capsid protein n=1 Tax=Dialister invisus TaxID=218538 RepID=UPI0023F832F7|nr:phage major capsid protein [Dialister invisus]